MLLRYVLLPTWALMRTVRVRCDVKGTARRARQRWHCAGCKRTADDVCMLVKLDDMADKRKVFVDAKKLFNRRLWQTKMGKDWLAIRLMC